MSREEEPFRRIILVFICVLCFVAPVCYSHLVVANAINAPYWDDFDCLLKFLNYFLESDSIGEKFGHLIVQHNEHRLIFLRLVAVSVFHLKGDLDFRLLCYTGNAALAAIAFFLFLAFKTRKTFKILCFCPVLFLLFQPQHYDSVLWPTALFSYFYSLLFSLITLYFLRKSGWFSFVSASLFGILAAFSQSNGLLVFVVGLGLLLVIKRYKSAGLWLLISGLVWSGYFIGYSRLPGNPPLGEALLNVKAWISYIFCFAGSAPGFSLLYPSLLLGIGIILWFIFLTARKYYQDNPTLYFLFLFVLLTTALNALFRSWKGVEFVLIQPRYKFISVCAVILVYLSMCEIVKRKKHRLALALTGLVAASLFFAFSIHLYSPKIVEISETMKRGLLKWHVDGSGLFYPFQEEANEILKESIERDVYKYPDRLIEEFTRGPFVFSPADVGAGLDYFLDTVVENQEFVYVDGWVFLQTEDDDRQTTFVLLRSRRQTVAIPTLPIRRTEIAATFPTRNPKDLGFGVMIRKEMIRPGRYRVGVYVKRGERGGMGFSEKYIEINE